MFKIAAAALIFGGMSAPLAAQYSSVKVDFVNAVRDRDGDKVNQLLSENPSGLLDARDGEGNTPLIITIARQDEWAGFLLGKGADPNLPGKAGDTPLIVAARVGYLDAIEWLLDRGAKIDAANRMGETPLIVAVQGRRTQAVRRLLEAGANPDRTDSAAGLSARDYAQRDARSRQILQMIEAKKPKAAAAAR
jgi:ankyrin repeat protein